MTTGKVEVQGFGGRVVARAWIEATVTRADGTVEELGVIADSGLPSPHRRTLFERMKGVLHG